LRAADSAWTEIRSRHFDVITDAGEKRGHEVALRLEQMQAVFAGFLLKQELARPIPLTVIAIRGDKDYSAIAPRQPAGVLPPRPADRETLAARRANLAFVRRRMDERNAQQRSGCK